MAHLHFPAAMPFRKRLIQLGEQPARIHVFGALGVAALRQMDFLDRPALENALQLKLSTPLFIVTHHPPGGDAASVLAETQALLCALAGFPEATVVFTQANADAHGSLIDTAIREFARDRANVRIVGTLGQRRYLSLARLADVAIGNSSSGIVEMPALGVPSVDIGERQRGRPRPRSVVHAAARAESIRRAIVETLRPEFRATLADLPLVYDGDQGTAQGIVQTLMTVPLDDALMRKVFFVP
jgi:UDP-hydrolysing UDP-N-acetyl-D-glucosamine 2-epimerase